MNKKIILLTLLFCIIFSLAAQEIKNDIIDVKYSKKSARKAMILSSLFPGAGQFYADKSNLATYIFPIIEIGLWAGYIYYNNEGKNAESDYEDYADLHYRREYQHAAEDDIKMLSNTIHNDNGFYDEHFLLDDSDTQHFYEDIGKYDKYVYGWLDWFDIYAAANPDPDIDWTFEWIWDDDDIDGDRVMGSIPLNEESAHYVGNEEVYNSTNGRYSSYRQEYIEMRKDAEKLYDSGRYFSFGIVANHIASALHAVSITRKYNRAYITTTSNVEFKLAPIMVNNNLSPALFVQTRF
ncbi:MAG: hypothetical protein DRH79_01405 [Candidatus Cloacimonadota bacterium]|nr:MAG: hypothetical protein DRH79_01405 [Candidatus Cloacimonadota bacterium]